MQTESGGCNSKYCKYGFYDNGNTCVKSCSENQQINLDNNTCYCLYGQANNKNCNEPCENSSYAIKQNNANGKCVVVQHCYDRLDAAGDACNMHCLSKSIHTLNGQCQYCPNGISVYKNKCKECTYGVAQNPNYCNDNCPPDTEYKHYKNTSSGQCEYQYCPNGFDPNNNCIQECPKYGERDGAGNCYCPYGIAQNPDNCNEKCENLD